MSDIGLAIAPAPQRHIRSTTPEWESGRRLMRRMLDDLPLAVMTVDVKTFLITYVNETSRALVRRIEHLLPIKADSLIGSSIDLFHRHPEHQRRILSDPANLPHSVRITLGSEVLELKVTAVTAEDGSYIGPMLTWAIVTKEVAAEQRILQLAHFDTLTGLANRTTFQEHLRSKLIFSRSGASLLYIDLDGFKLINDTGGHLLGDKLLCKVADRIREVCDADGCIIGRLGGDEFAVLMPNGKLAAAECLAARLIEALTAPYTLDHDRPAQIGASIGIALAPYHGTASDLLLARADIALYAAKNSGKGHFRVFSGDMEDEFQERVRLQGKLREALINNDGLFVFYQPIVDAETEIVTSREALVRWHHPKRGWISPAEFIPIAEQSGLIDRIGTFVLQTACREAVGWADGSRVAVNVSAMQLGRNTIVETVLSALESSGLPANRLEIEVTETAVLDEKHGGGSDLHRLRDMGVRIALDDFGTGYSSLTHLRAFPFDKIKIDGSFVRDAVSRPECAAVVRAIADLGKRLGVRTVAEGVETREHLRCVIQEGCDEVQGYFFGRPQPAEPDIEKVAALNHAR